MNRPHLLLLSLTLLLGTTSACSAEPAPIRPEPVDAAWLSHQRIPSSGALVSAARLKDKSGIHVLVLNRKAGPSPSKPGSGRTENIQLTATYYAQAQGGWKQEWTVRDGVDCPGLDASADFFAKSLAFSDLNADGNAEVTIPYQLFCGGGVDSHTVKVILRDGSTKLAIRGESRVELPGQEPFGGEHTYDKPLLRPDMAAYKQHLDKIWQAVSVDKRK